MKIKRYKFIIVPAPRAVYNILPPREGFIKSWAEEVSCDTLGAERLVREAEEAERQKVFTQATTWLGVPSSEIPQDHSS